MNGSQNKVVAIQGGYGSFHHLAANKYFAHEKVVLAPYTTFPELFIALKTNKVDYAVVAIENTIAGSLAFNYSLIIDANATIIDELWLSVSQNLITLPETTIQEIEEIHSHPAAILQCRAFLEPLISRGVKIVETSNTALSVKYIHDTQATHIAAIGSLAAASLYRLDILAENINTGTPNFTRFLVLSASRTNNPVEDGHNCNKTTMILSITNQEQSISHLLKLFCYCDCQVTHILSLPRENAWKQSFIADIVYKDKYIIDNIIRLATKYKFELEVLGTYTLHSMQPHQDVTESVRATENHVSV